MFTDLEKPVCMFAMSHPEFFYGPDSGPLAAVECPAPPVTVDNCGFLVTSALALEGGGYEVCVQANDQAANQSWVIVMDPGGAAITMTGDGPNICWTFPDGVPTFAITQIIDEVECHPMWINIWPDEECPENAVTASVENCHFEANLDIDLSGLGNPFFYYVITFGDGSLAQQSSSSAVTHTYPQAGIYEVCLSYYVPGYEIAYITCCYTVEVPACVCPQDVVQITAVEPCTWIATLEFDLPASSFPITVNFGDGTSEVVNSSPVTHDYPDNDCYNVCYTYEPFPGSPVTCCELVCLPQCCLDAYFELNSIIPSPSCINPLYRISHVSCPGSNLSTTHTWEFSDGFVWNGPNPPDHLFSNFFDPNGQVCVIHTVTCCDESESIEVCAPHLAGAYVGGPGEETNFTDIVPTTNQTVWQFIQSRQAGGDLLPLITEGTLIADVNVPTFFNGTWNMGREAEIFVRGNFNTSAYRNLFLSAITIRSAIRLPSQPGCCPDPGQWPVVLCLGPVMF